jgi:hypothetical protein
VIAAGTPRYALRWAHEARGRIRLARDDEAGALEDAEQALGVARSAQDPQALQPALGFASFASLTTGRARAAAAFAEELLALDPVGCPIPSFSGPTFDLARVLPAVDREERLLDALRAAERPTRWDGAALAVLTGDLVGAADRYAEIGALPNEAYMRLRAAERLRTTGDDAAAEAQLGRSLAFWRSVGATRHIREAEALLSVKA